MKILLATDGSKESDAAINALKNLSFKEGDEIKIILDLESGHKVEVLILDIRGTIIKELAKGIFSPNNTVKEFSFSTALLQPGVYICRARIDGQILSRKFLVH